MKGPSPGTRSTSSEVGRWEYTAEMARVGACGTLEDGLVFLWAMERVSVHLGLQLGPG